MPEYLWDLCSFCKDVISRWIELVTGGAVAFAWLLYCQLTGKNIAMTPFYWILGVTLFLACFGAWREQFLKTKEEPKLWGRVNKTVIGSGQNQLSLLLLIHVTNTGPQTLVEGFWATLTVGNHEFKLNPVFIPENNRFEFDGRWITLKPPQLFFSQVSSPIVQGGRVRGYIQYLVEGLEPRELEAKGYQITIRFRDAAQNEYTFQSSNEDRPRPDTKPLAYPGFTDPFLAHVPPANPPRLPS
jgi:hypothetical protein